MKSEPVKKSQPVERYLQIINLYSEENKEPGLGSNEIWRLTGRTDKQQICSDIKSLVSYNILSSQKKQPGYKDPKLLTKLGKEIRQFIVDMDNFEKAHVELQEAVNKHFNVEPHFIPSICLDDMAGENNPVQSYEIRTMPVLMRNKFRANGWSDDEMTDYGNCYRAVHGLLLDHTIVVNATMSRYFDIIASNGLGVSKKNRNTMRILNQVLLKCIGKQLETTTGDYDIKYANNDRKNPPQADGRALQSRYCDGGIMFSGTWSVERYLEHLVMEGILNNRCISREAKEVLRAILFILRPHICHIEAAMDDIKNVAPHRFGNSERLNSLLILYEDIIERLR